jgi:hypothetical protein
MFQIFVPDHKVQGKKNITFKKICLNAMIRNIKIHNIIHIIEISKSIEPHKFIQKNVYENVYLKVSYDLKFFNGSRKIKV